MSSGVIDKDLGWDRIKREMAKAKGSFTKVGILAADADEPYGDGTDLVEVAAYNEFGTEDIPERSYLRSTTDEERNKVNRVVDKELDKIHLGTSTVEQSLGLVGEYMASKVRNKIVAIQNPPNAPATIARKKSSNPLIDTGQLRQNISHEETIRG